MIYDEFTRHVGKAGLTLKAFAELVGMTPSSLSNYARKGRVPPHLVIIAVLMGEMAEKRLEFRELIQALEIPKKKPRGSGLANQTMPIKETQSRVSRMTKPNPKIGNDTAAPRTSTKLRVRRGPGAHSGRIG